MDDPKQPVEQKQVKDSAQSHLEYSLPKDAIALILTADDHFELALPEDDQRHLTPSQMALLALGMLFQDPTEELAKMVGDQLNKIAELADKEHSN